MSLHDYLIDCSSFDWKKLVAAWHWRLPRTFTTWMMNRFGDLFLKTDDGKIHLLKLDDGSLQCLADSREHFADKLDDEQTANDWFMIPLVDSLVAAGKALKPGECYGFIQPPILGGDYVVSNVRVRSVTWQYATLGRFFENLEGVPDGSKVEHEVGDEEKG